MNITKNTNTSIIRVPTVTRDTQIKRLSDSKLAQTLSKKPSAGFQSPRFASVEDAEKAREEIKEEDRTRPQFIEEAL